MNTRAMSGACLRNRKGKQLPSCRNGTTLSKTPRVLAYRPWSRIMANLFPIQRHGRMVCSIRHRSSTHRHQYIRTKWTCRTPASNTPGQGMHHTSIMESTGRVMGRILCYISVPHQPHRQHPPPFRAVHHLNCGLTVAPLYPTCAKLAAVRSP